MAAALLVASCVDNTGPGRVVYGSLALEPVFVSEASGIVPVAAGRFMLRRTSDAVLVKDTVILLGEGADSVDLTLSVPLTSASETFELTIALVDAAGDTVFRAGPLTVEPTVGSEAPPAIPVPVVYTGVGSDASSIVIQTPDTALFFNQQLTVVAVALDSAGQPIPNTPIEFRSLDATRIGVARPDSGRIVALPLRGPAQIVARLLTGQADTIDVLSQPTPNSLTVDAGNNQSAGPGQPLPNPLVARVLAADALGVEGIWVRFTVTAGGGSVSADSVLTDPLGRAFVNFTLGASGPQTVEATTADLAGQTAAFGATVVAQRATALLIVSGDGQTGLVGTILEGSIEVEARDAGNAPFPGDTVVFTITQGGGSVSTDTVVTDANGRALTFWTLGTGAGTHAVRAELITGAALVDFTATALPGSATRLAFTVQPTATGVNGVITPAPAVTAFDQFSNVATAFTGPVSLSLLANPGGATLAGTATVNATAGVATFADLSLNLPASGYTLQATDTGLEADTSAAFDVLAPQGNVFWINAAGGTWSVGANWSTGAPPTAVDTAVIVTPGNYTVALNAPVTVATLVLGGSGSIPNLALTSNLTVNDSAWVAPGATLSQTAGALGGLGVYVVDGSYAWNGGSHEGANDTRIGAGGALTIGASVTLNNRFLENGGTLSWTAGNVSAGNGASLFNQPGALLQFAAPGGAVFDYNFGAAPILINQGAMTVNSTGTLFFDWTLDLSEGTFAVEAGAFEPRAGGTLGTDVTVNGGATFNLNGGTYFANTIALGGTGTALLTSGVLNVPGTDVLTVNLPFAMVAGQLTGTGTVVIPDGETFTWTGGTIDGGGILEIQSGATFLLDTPGTLGDRDVVNNGLTQWTQGNLSAGNGATFLNQPGATFNALATGSVWDYNFGAAPVFTNQGDVTIAAGAGTIFFDWFFELSAGTFVVQSGTFEPRAGATLAAPLTLAVGTTLNLNGGTYTTDQITIGGGGAVELSSGVVTLADPDTLTLALPLTQTGGQITGTGTVLIPETFLWSGGTIDGGGVLRIADTATFTLTNPGTLGDRAVQNAGTTLWTAGNLSAGNGATFLNEATGSFTAQAAGATWDYNFGAQPVITNQGTMTVNTAGTVFMDWFLNLSAGTFTVAGGDFQPRAGGTLATDVTLATGTTLQLNGGTFTADAVSLTGAGAVTLMTGTLTADAPDELTLVVPFTQTGGILTGTGTVTIVNTYTWNGGSIEGAGVLRIPAGTTFLLDGPGTLNTRTVENEGSIEWVNGNLTAGNGATIVNLAAGSFTAQAVDATWDYNFGTQPVFDNQGSFQVTSSGLVFFDWTMTHTGVLTVASGGIEFRGGGSFSATMTVDAAATAALNGGSYTLLSGFGTTGAGGGLSFTSGVYTVTAPDTVFLFGPTIMAGGTLTGTGAVVAAASPTAGFTWTGGSMDGAGSLDIENGVGFGIAGGVTLTNRFIRNAGTAVWSGGTINAGNGSTILNEATGTWLITATGATLDYNFGVQPTFTNEGLLQSLSTGTVFVDWIVDNRATLDVLSGTLAIRAPFTHATSGVLSGSGTLDLASATVNAFDGTVNPGSSPGLLTLAGDYVPSSSAILNVELEGTTAVALYDQLAVTGGATLKGTLNVTLPGGFAPVAGNQFTIMTYGSVSADFGTVNLPALTPPLAWQRDINATSMVLTVTGPAPQILFAGDSAGRSIGVFRVDQDGASRFNVTPEGPDGARPRWSPDRSRVTYAARATFGVPNQLHVISADGGSPAHLTSSSDTSTWFPRYNPTGKHLAFECGDGFGMFDVCVIANVDGPIASLEGIGDGAGKVFVTDFDTQNFDLGPGAFAWDPQTQDRLAFVREDQTGASSIFTSLFDGSGVQLLAGPLDVGNGSLTIVGRMDWSSDGTRLVFVAQDGQATQKLYLIDRNGEGLTQLTVGPDPDSDPVFSPDGLTVLFRRDKSCSSDLWRIDISGANETQVSDDQICDFDMSILGHDWSPDGSQIVLASWENPFSNTVIYVIPAATTFLDYVAVRRIVGHGADLSDPQDKHPSWRP